MADKKLTFPIEASHIMMFARAVGYANPLYESGAIAPPTFLQAAAQFDPDYHLRPQQHEPWFGSGRTPTGLTEKPKSSGGLHAEQHFEYKRPIRAGEVLTVEYRDGESWEKESKRAGKLKFRERVAEYRDQAGEVVAIVRSVGVTTERPVEQG